MRNKSSILILLIILGIFLSLILVIFVVWQYNHYNNLSDVSCGGDWSYNVKCPLGSYCASLNQGPYAGGICRPFLAPIFGVFRITKD